MRHMHLNKRASCSQPLLQPGHWCWALGMLLALLFPLLPGGQAVQAQGPLPDKFLFAIGAQATVGQFNWPFGIAVAPDGTVYVADTWNCRVQRFSATGSFLTKWGSQGAGDGQFNNPRGIAVAPDGTVYVADTDNHRVQRFSATGIFLGKWGSQGSGNGQFSYPNGIAVAPDGTVYVADGGNHRVQRFSPTGAFLTKWGSYGAGDGQFAWPFGIAVAPDGTVYVADSGNHRVQRFSATGAFLTKWGSQGAGDGQLNGPFGIAVAADGTVYVVDSGNCRVQAFGTSYPNTWRGEYYANKWLTGAPALIRQDADIDFQWGTGSPASSVPADSFSARWLRYVHFPASCYRFTLFADDGVRLWIDGTLLVDRWQQQVATYEAEASLSEGYHRILLEYYEEGGSAAVRLSWTRLGPWQEFLPAVLKKPFLCQEPANNTRQGACGPLLSGQVYREYISSPSDEFDWFFFDMPAAHTIEAWLREIPAGCDYDLYLRDSAGNHITSSAQSGNKDEHILWGPLPAGRYYLVVARIEGWNANVPYALRVEY